MITNSNNIYIYVFIDYAVRAILMIIQQKRGCLLYWSHSIFEN